MALMLVIVAAAGQGCGLPRNTMNVGGPIHPPVPRATVTVPLPMVGGKEATWVVSWTGGYVYPGDPAFSVTWRFGGGAEPNEVTIQDAPNPCYCTVRMINPDRLDVASYDYEVVVMNSLFISDSSTSRYYVNPIPNNAPVIESASFQERRLTVVVSDADSNEELVVEVQVPNGMTIDEHKKMVTPTIPRTVAFEIGVFDIIKGARGEAKIWASDGIADTGPELLELSFPPLNLAEDTLYAIPNQPTTTTADEVTVIIATGILASPFQFVNGVGLTVETTAEYVRGSFDIGAPDYTLDSGGTYPIDGLWEAMKPAGGFLQPPDNFILSSDIGGGRERWDFNINPIGGMDLTAASGALFNFKLSFGAAGVYHLGFQRFAVVDRTYYSAEDGVLRFWDDISNDHAGIPNSITVN